MKEKVKYTQRSVRIPKELYEQAKEIAEKDSRSFNNLVVLAIKEYINNNVEIRNTLSRK